MKCRHCHSDLRLVFADLGSAPPSNAYLSAETLRAPEKWFPLRVLVCETCWLVQTEDFAKADELFDADYAYFSGFSDTWLEHCKRYVGEMVDRFALGPDSHVVEIAANDGSLLQYVKQRGIPCTGIEPTARTAAAARQKGIPIIEDFFTGRLATALVGKGRQADLVAANNVLAHVPDINDFAAGVAALLKPRGVATFEFPSLLNLIVETQFDTIYHEHFSYLSFTAAHRIFNVAGLTVFDVQELPTHGGSLRVFVQRGDMGRHAIGAAVPDMLAREARQGIATASCYADFQARIAKVKNDFLAFLLRASEEGKTVAGYGAAAKGNTLFNFAGIRGDLIRFVADRNPAKTGKFMPGSRIPIVDVARIAETKPDYIVILPWNLRSEITQQLDYVRGWGARFVVAIPRIEVS
jgi:2-polyprenyl-3-methyl-5-hydroxy-6-metoxy-1,4-benzoquinol methylase